jgi:hypothetical protein
MIPPWGGITARKYAARMSDPSGKARTVLLVLVCFPNPTKTKHRLYLHSQREHVSVLSRTVIFSARQRLDKQAVSSLFFATTISGPYYVMADNTMSHHSTRTLCTLQLLPRLRKSSECA